MESTVLRTRMRLPPLPITAPRAGPQDGALRSSSLSLAGPQDGGSRSQGQALRRLLAQLQPWSCRGPVGDMSLLAEALGQFLSGASQGFSREWWLELLDILRLVRPHREGLVGECGRLLPSLVQLNRQYELHRSLLRDLDIPGALHNAFPPDTSALYRLPNNLEERYRTQPPPVYLHELAHHVGGVGAELAAAESMWQCGPKGLHLALCTDLPMIIQPDTDRPTSRAPDVLHQPLSPDRSLGAAHHQVSGYDAAEILVKLRHLGKVVFMYLNRTGAIQDSSYDLRVTLLSHLQPEHFVFSPFGVLHVHPTCGSEVQELGVWHREAVLCRTMRRIPFYREFLKMRAFRRWRRVVTRISFVRRRVSLSRTLVLSVPHYLAALHHISRFLQELALLPWFPGLLSHPISIDQLEAEQRHTRSMATRHLGNLLGLTTRVLEMVREDTYIMVRTSQEDGMRCPEEATMGQQQHIESWLLRLGNLSSLVGHMINENLTSIMQQNISSFVMCLAEMMPSTGRPLLLVRLEFGEEAELRLCPSAGQIQRSVEQMLDSVLDSMLEVMAASDQDHPVASSMPQDPTQHGSPVFPIPGGQNIHQLVPGPSLPSAKSRPMPGRLMVVGHRQKAHYLPRNFQSLQYMLLNDRSIQEARKTLQRLLEDSLHAVETFCEEHAWLSDIHQYVQSWSPHSLKELRGSSARCYDDLILKLQNWEQRVCGLKGCVTTAMLEVSCEFFHTQTGCGLAAILRDILNLLTSEVAEKSNSLIYELSQALEIFRDVSTEISSFSYCADKVAEFKMKKHELAEQVEHVRSLHEVIRMNYRPQTVEEQKLNSKLTDTWDMFQHFLKASAEFLSSHLSSMSGSLEQSFQACYKEAEDLIVACSSTRYQDPSQDLTLTLRDLGSLHRKVCSVLSKLREFSHSRQVLLGKSFDLSAISVGEQQIQARQDSWKLLSSCREQIAGWKLSTFMKVNTERMREKLQLWEKSLQDLTLVLHEGDPILQCVVDSLQDFSQHLPLVQSLLDPAVKHKHWAAIFAVMERPMVGLKTLTLMELLSDPLLKQQDQIHKILLQARAEFSVFQEFGKIQTSWQEKEFCLVRFFLCVSKEDPPPDLSKRPPSGRHWDRARGYSSQDTGTFLLADAHTLRSFIDDSLLSLHAIRSSPYSASHCDEISRWIHKLQSLGHILDLWVTFQKKWVFLTKVQSEMEISLSRVEMMAEFQSIDRSYRSFLEVTVQDPLVLSILNPSRRREWHLHGDSLCSALQRGISVMETMLLSLVDVLYAFRCDFPRLFFLSDQEVIDVLAASPDPLDRLPCALLCFPYFTDMLFQIQSPDSYSFPVISKHLTIGVIGSHGEALHFNSPLTWNPGTVSWLKELDQRVRESLMEELTMSLAEGRLSCLPQQPKLHDQLWCWVQHGVSFHLQCLVVTEEVVWCELMEKLILTDQRSWLRDWHNVKIELLVQRLRQIDRANQQEMAFLSAWISLAVLQRDRTWGLLDNGIQTLDSFSWAKLMKYRAPTPPGTQGDGSDAQPGSDTVKSTSPLCFVDVLGHSFTYEHEYVGLDMKIMEPAVSERTSLGIILALERYECGAVIGQDEGLRTQTLLALGNALGRQVVVLKCWAGIDVIRLTLHLEGALQGGAWLVLDSAQRLKCNVLTSLGQLLSAVQSSCEALKKAEVSGHEDERAGILGYVQLEERTLPVRRSYSCFVTLPHMDSPTDLPSSLRLLLRPVSFCSPDLKNIAELSLLSAGFQDHLTLAKKLSCFLQLAVESGVITRASVLPLLKNIIQKAAVSLKLDKTATRSHGDSDQCQSPPSMDVGSTTLTLGLQEETKVVTALLASSLWSSHQVAEENHLKDLLRSVFPVSVSLLACAQPEDVLSQGLRRHLHESGLEIHTELSNNVMQLYQAIQQGSGVLLTGPAGSGKTTCWKALQQTLNLLAANEVSTSHETSINGANTLSYQYVQSVHLYPNSLSTNELFGGAMDGNGVFSSVLHRASQGSAVQKWMILDGSVALEWVEPISCLFGPWPFLTLPTGQQLHLTDKIKIVFEMPDLLTLSPAMSTLCSLVYCGGHETWRAILKSSISSMCIKYRVMQSTQHKLQTLCEYLIPQTLGFLEDHCSSALHPHPARPSASARGVQHISSFCTILYALMDQHLLRDSSYLAPEQAEHEDQSHGSTDGAQSFTQTSTLTDKDQGILCDNHQRAQTFFLYAFVWAFGGHLHARHRSEFDEFLRKSLTECALQVEVPQDISVFEVTPAPDSLTLIANPAAGQSDGLPFAARCLVVCGHPVLLVGGPGNGKTTLAQSLVPPAASTIRIAVNSLLQAAHLRQLVKAQESPPPVELMRVRAMRGRRLFFLDDLHEAWTDPKSGTQPALEVIRQIMSEKGPVLHHSFLATVSPPEDGHGSPCPRLTRLFCVLVMTPSSPDVLRSLFSHRFRVWLKKSSFQQPQEFSEALAAASICLYQQVTKAFQLQYCFSLHHLHRLLQSVTFLCPSPGANLPAMPDAGISSADWIRCGIERLWLHEALRTFGDVLETLEEQRVFREILQSCLVREFSNHHRLDNMALADVTGTVDSEMINEDGKIKSELQTSEAEEDSSSSDHTPSPTKVLVPLDLITRHGGLQDLTFLHEYSCGLPVRSDSYRERPSEDLKTVQTDDNLTLSPEDCHHLAHLTRVLHLPRGHIVLRSEHPGTGRRSLARLAARLTQCALRELSGKESTEERHTIIREVCFVAGVQGSSAAILLGEDNPRRAEQELEAVIREGTCPGLYSADQEEAILQVMEKTGNKNTSKKSLRERFHTQVCNNLHVIFLQKIGARSPQLQRLSYSDIYHPWSATALQQVVEKLLNTFQMCGPASSSVSRVMTLIHLLAQSYSHRMWPDLPLTTAGTFINFIQTYLKVFSKLQRDVTKEEERLRRAVTRVQQLQDVQEMWTKEMEKCSQRLQEAEEEREHWSQEHEKMKEEEERVTAECEELERTKERVRERLTRLQLQRQGDLEQTRLQWAAVQKELRVLDVEELRSYRAPPPPVIMVTDVLCTVFGREPGWENAKLLLGQDHFYQDLQFYDGHKMADSVFSSLSRAVRRPDFSVHLVQPVSAAAGSLCHWLRGLQRYCSVLRRLEKGRALLSEVEAEDLRVAQKIADQRLRQEKVMRHKDQCAQNLQKSLEAKQELQREAHQLRSKQAQAQQCEGRARPHLTTWTAALEVLQRRRQALQMDALLVSASITYLGCVPWTRCTTLMDKWSSLCCGDEVSLEPDDIREELDTPHTAHSAAGRVLKLLCSPSLRMRWQKERLPITTETLTRASILQARALYSELRPTLILDPDVRAERCLQVLLCAGDQERGKSSQGQGDQTNLLDRTQELCVIDALDMELTQRLSSALELGLCVLIKNVEKMPSCLEMICSVRCRTHCHPLSTSSSMETPSCLPSPPVTRGDGASPSSHVFLSTSLPLKTFIQEVGATFLKEVTVVDLSLGSSGLKEEMVQEIMRFRDPRLQEERWRLSWNALKLMEELRGAEDSLLEYVSTGTVPLVEDKDFLDRVSSCEEAQAMLQPSLLDVEALQQQIGDSMTQYTSAAQNCVHLFARMQEVSRLSPHYHFPASSVLRWALGALSGQAESGRDLEKVLTSGVLRCALPMIAEEHRYILQVLLAVGKPHPLEWFSFLGLACKSSLETSSSCIQRPQWIHISAWEEIAQLEKLSVFQGIRSSLSTQSKQWQEYFTLRSTVIGPVPCSSFSHLTLFQVAILWRILKPECLGLVLSHLTSCILGPGPEDKCEDEEVIGQSDPGSTVLFIVPPVSPDIPMNFIQHMAKKKGTEVKIISCSEALPASTMRDTLRASQQEGCWILLDWQPALADLRVTAEDEVNADFRLCVAVEEEMLRSVPVALRCGPRFAPCALRFTLRDFLLRSCLDVVEDLGEKNPLTLRLLILHSVLLLRQEYSPYVQRHTYCWRQKDLRNALQAVRTVMAQCKDWDQALPFITGAIIYGGHILEEDDVRSVTAVAQHCLQEPHHGSGRGLSHVMSALVAGGGSGSGLHGVTLSLQRLLSMKDPAALGLCEGLKNVTTNMSGRKVFSDLLITQDIWTISPTRAEDHRAPSGQCSFSHDDFWRRTLSSSSPRTSVVATTIRQCLDFLLELEGPQVAGADAHVQAPSAEENPPTATAHEQPLRRYLLGEWRLLQNLLREAINEARDAASSCLCQRCEEVRKELSAELLPRRWKVYSPASPMTLQTWIQNLHLRHRLLSTYVTQTSPLNVSYNLNVFQRPSGLFHSLLLEQALEEHRDLESYQLRVEVSGRTSPQLPPVGVSLVGVHLCHALWDTRLDLLQETLSPQLCALPAVHVSVVPAASSATQCQPPKSLYLCPLYMGEGPADHLQQMKSPLLLLPLPTKVSPSAWSQRGVYALSLL